jgi:hypothetical protein
MESVLGTLYVYYKITMSTRVYPKVSGLSLNETYAYNEKRTLRSNTKGYGDEAH